MDNMSIAAASVGMNQGQVMQQFGVGVLKMAMNSEVQGTEALLESLPQESLDPNLGKSVDIQA